MYFDDCTSCCYNLSEEPFPCIAFFFAVKRFTMNCVTTALMVSAIVISISAKKMTERQSDKGLYTAKRVSM